MSEYYDHEHERYPMSEENTCCCGLYVHPKRRNPSAIHIKDCPYHPDNDPGISSDKPLLPPWTEVELQRCYLAKDYWKRKRIYFDTREEALKYRDEQPYKHSSSLRKMVREILFIFPATDKRSRRYYNKRVSR